MSEAQPNGELAQEGRFSGIVFRWRISSGRPVRTLINHVLGGVAVGSVYYGCRLLVAVHFALSNPQELVFPPLKPWDIVSVFVGVCCSLTYYHWKIRAQFDGLKTGASELLTAAHKMYSGCFPELINSNWTNGALVEMLKKAQDYGDRLEDAQQDADVEAQRKHAQDVDRRLKKPLAYANNVVSGRHFPPGFNRHEQYITSLHKPSTKSVVAVTSVDPSMWIDPVFVFHLMNTGLLATKQEINRRLKRYHCEKTGILRLGGKPCKAVFESFPELENDRYAESCMALAKKLANKPLVEIDPFVARFFILENQHVEDCDSDLLPALVAFHELCGAKAFFLRKEGLEDYLMSEEVSLWDRYDQSIQETWAGLDSPTGDEWRDYEFANGLDFWAFPKFPEFFFVLEEGDGHGRLRCYSYRKGQVLAGDMPPNNHGAFLIQTLADAYLTGISSAPVDPIRKALLWEQKGVIERTTLSIG